MHYFFPRLGLLAIPLIGVALLNPIQFWQIFAKGFLLILFFSLLFFNKSHLDHARFLTSIHMPGYLVFIFLLTVIYLNDLLLEVKNLKQQLRLRGYWQRENILQAKKLGPLIGMIFLRSLKKAEVTHQVLKLRGWSWKT